MPPRRGGSRLKDDPRTVAAIITLMQRAIGKKRLVTKDPISSHSNNSRLGNIGGSSSRQPRRPTAMDRLKRLGLAKKYEGKVGALCAGAVTKYYEIYNQLPEKTSLEAFARDYYLEGACSDLFINLTES